MTLSMGGRYCFWRMISGPVEDQEDQWRLEVEGLRRGSPVPVDLSRMATMPTPSMSLPLGRVVRSHDSQSLTLPVGSLYVILSREDKSDLSTCSVTCRRAAGR